MSKRFKKFIAIVSAIAMVVTSMTVYNTTAKAADYSTLEYTQVGSKDYYVAAANDEFPFQMLQDQGNQMLIIPQVSAGNKPIWPDFKDATLNGDAFQQIPGAGIYIAYDLLIDNEYNVFEATSAVDGHRFQIIIKAGTPAGGEDESPSEDSGEVEETTTVLQVPGKPTGLVANINDLKTNYTIAFAPISGATSFNLYIDGELYGQIGNGGILTIADAGLGAGQTYLFQVSGVNAAGEGELSDAVSVTIPTVEEETTTEGSGELPSEPVEEFDPSTITEWTPVLNSTTLSYYIADGKTVNVGPQMNGTNLYVAYPLAAKFSSVTLDGEAIEPRAGADVEIPGDKFTEGYHTLVVTDFYGTNTTTIYFKAEAEEETTTAAYVEGEVLVDESNVTKEVPAYEGGDPWQAEYNNTPVKYVQGKNYVAEVVVSSDVDKPIKLVFQNTNGWSFIDAAGGYEYTIAAGTKVKITYVFEAVQGTDAGNYDIYLGTVADAATLVFESKKITTYTEVPAGVATGVEVLSAPTVTEYEVTVDGAVVATLEEGAEYTLPTDATYGYYSDGAMYKAGATITVTDNVAFTSVNELSVEAAQGAGIRYADTAGIRFQATVSSDNMDAVEAQDAITTGMIITANDIYTSHGSVLTLEAIADLSKYAALNIVNDGWYEGEVGTYCGSIVNIADSNWIRDFIAVAYVTITYTDGTTTTVYSNMTGVRSITGVAQAVQAAGYVGIPEAYKAKIDEFAAAK